MDVIIILVSAFFGLIVFSIIMGLTGDYGKIRKLRKVFEKAKKQGMSDLDATKAMIESTAFCTVGRINPENFLWEIFGDQNFSPNDVIHKIITMENEKKYNNEQYCLELMEYARNGTEGKYMKRHRKLNEIVKNYGEKKEY